MKRIGMVLCVALLVLALTVSALAEGATGSVKFEGDGFDTPEDAIAAYIEARRVSDVQGMISTFAIETYVDSYDPKAYVSSVQSFSAKNYRGVPVADTYSRQLLILQRVAEISDNLYFQYLWYIWPDELRNSFEAPVRFSDEDAGAMDAFIGQLSDPERASVLTDIELIDFIPVGKFDAELESLFHSMANQKNLMRTALMCRCDEVVERIAHVKLGGEEGYLFMQCARYGDKWYNVGGPSNLSMLLETNYYAGGLVLADDLN